jgi:hypothetical protein
MGKYNHFERYYTKYKHGGKWRGKKMKAPKLKTKCGIVGSLVRLKGQILIEHARNRANLKHFVYGSNVKRK